VEKAIGFFLIGKRKLSLVWLIKEEEINGIRSSPNSLQYHTQNFKRNKPEVF
jgi:hypothetical protein